VTATGQDYTSRQNHCGRILEHSQIGHRSSFLPRGQVLLKIIDYVSWAVTTGRMMESAICSDLAHGPEVLVTLLHLFSRSITHLYVSRIVEGASLCHQSVLFEQRPILNGHCRDPDQLSQPISSRSLPHPTCTRTAYPMSTTMSTILSTSNARNSSRQTRTNPTRTSRVLGSSLRQNSLISNPAPVPVVDTERTIGFFPAIGHFTDAITALPRDYRRHTSLLKEVDAKAWAPEENLQKLLQSCLAAKPSREDTANSASVHASTTGSVTGGPEETTGAIPDNASVHSTATANASMTARRELFGNLRHNLMVMMVTMDEKNHVINNANEELSRHLRRLNGSYPAIADEVSEEARLGSLKHWAYFETNPVRRGGTQGDRRQAGASLAALHATEAAERSENRREAVLAKKARLNQIDSDFDESRPATRKPQANGRNRRIGELAAENAGLGISGAGAGKRKKTEKGTAGSAVGERSLTTAGIGGRAMSREPSQQEQKKRKAPTSNPTGTAPARKRYLSAKPSLIYEANNYFPEQISVHKTRLSLSRPPWPVHSAKMYLKAVLSLALLVQYRPGRARTRTKLWMLHKQAQCPRLRERTLLIATVSRRQPQS
jgi:Inhibitor of growth proteins N-terminal histone-binding